MQGARQIATPARVSARAPPFGLWSDEAQSLERRGKLLRRGPPSGLGWNAGCPLRLGVPARVDGLSTSTGHSTRQDAPLRKGFTGFGFTDFGFAGIGPNQKGDAKPWKLQGCRLNGT